MIAELETIPSNLPWGQSRWPEPTFGASPSYSIEYPSRTFQAASNIALEPSLSQSLQYQGLQAWDTPAIRDSGIAWAMPSVSQDMSVIGEVAPGQDWQPIHSSSMMTIPMDFSPSFQICETGPQLPLLGLTDMSLAMDSALSDLELDSMESITLVTSPRRESSTAVLPNLPSLSGIASVRISFSRQWQSNY